MSTSRRGGESARRIVGLLVFVFGIACLGGAAWLAVRDLAWAKRASRATAVVVEDQYGSEVCAVLRFTPSAAGAQPVTAKSCTRHREYDPGQSVDVLYDPADPAGSAKVATAEHLATGTIVFGFWGVVWSIVGAVVAFRRRTHRAGAATR